MISCLMSRSVSSGETVVTYSPPAERARSTKGAFTAYVRLRRDRISANRRPESTAVATRSAS